MRHTPDHDVWSPDGRCDAPVHEADGNVTRCGYVRSVEAFDLRPDPPRAPESRAPRIARNVIVGTAMAVLGLLIALDWLAFFLYVTRNGGNPANAMDLVVRVAVSGAYGAAAVWLWRRS